MGLPSSVIWENHRTKSGIFHCRSDSFRFGILICLTLYSLIQGITSGKFSITSGTSFSYLSKEFFRHKKSSNWGYLSIGMFNPEASGFNILKINLVPRKNIFVQNWFTPLLPFSKGNMLIKAWILG